MSFNIHRRTLLKGATATGLLAAFQSSGMPFLFEADKPYRVGLIGTGWYGKSDLFRLIQVSPVEVVALCDVDKNMLSEAATMVSQGRSQVKNHACIPTTKKCLLKVLLILCLFGTPDHWHALQTIDAVKAGAHVYVQKPY
jgi:predicted dehydrogenase